MDYFPASDTPNKRTNMVVYSLVGNNKSGKAYIDLTGRFPFISKRGNQYILVAYNYDGNYISAEVVKNRESASLEKAWKIINGDFDKAGIAPETYIVDNEASMELKQAMTEKISTIN